MAKKVALPANVEAERSVLGAMMMDKLYAGIALSSLEENDFSDVDPRHKILFRAMKEVNKSGNPIDAQTIYNELVTLHLDKSFGDISYIIQLVNSMITPENIETYVHMVREQSVLRQLLLKVSEIQDNYTKGVPDIGEFITKANDEISDIAQLRTVEGMRSAKDVANVVHEKINKTSSRQDKGLLGVDTGYAGLNKLTHGWQKGDLIILAARPSVGKTAFGLNLAYNAAFYSKVAVAFFSLEMTAEKIMERLIAREAMVENQAIQLGNIHAQEKMKIKTAVDTISKTEIYFDDTPNMKLGDIIASATQLRNKTHNLGLIVIDYLGRITTGERVDPNARQQEVSRISGQLKSLARTLNVPVLCLCQLNRDVEKEGSKRPGLSHLRESGSIEQDADIVMLMYRENYYTNLGQSVSKKKTYRDKQEEEKPEEENLSPEEKEKRQNTAETEIIVAKNRNGITGTVKLNFLMPYSRFTDQTQSYVDKMAKYQRGGDDDE